MALEEATFLIDPDTAPAAALALGASRAIGVLTIFPIFSLVNLSGILRIGLAVGLSAPAVAVAYDALGAGTYSFLQVALLAIKEFGFGLVLGAGLGMPFWAAQAAGDMTDVYRGASAANIFDQVNALETTALGSVLLTFSLMLFVSAGGFVDLVSVFYTSFAFWPLLEAVPRMSQSPLVAALDIFATLFKTAALLSAPFMIVTFAVELAFTYTGRSAKQLQLNDLLPVFKNLTVVSVLLVYTIFIGSYYEEAWTRGFNQLRTILEADLGQK